MDQIDHREAEIRIDFLQNLETDVSLHVLSFLDDPGDLVRATAVSPLWHQLVIKHRFAQKLCLKEFPHLYNVDIADASLKAVNSVVGGADDNEVWEALLWDHKVHASLLQVLKKSKVPPKDCILTAVSASSTDDYPDESIVNTLSSMDRYMGTASYWSSIGQSEPNVPETLIYKLRPGVWAITEIQIRPFEAFFEPGNPIYSATSVRFRMGHPKPDVDCDFRRLPLHNPADNMFEWTYTSPVYPMTQENRLQPFKLPEPALCVNSFLQIELLGRTQKKEIDGLYYLCVCHVRAMGQALSPAFEIDIVEPDRKMTLKYYPDRLQSVLEPPVRYPMNIELFPNIIPVRRNEPRDIEDPHPRVPRGPRGPRPRVQDGGRIHLFDDLMNDFYIPDDWLQIHGFGNDANDEDEDEDN